MVYLHTEWGLWFAGKDYNMLHFEAGMLVQPCHGQGEGGFILCMELRYPLRLLTTFSSYNPKKSRSPCYKCLISEHWFCSA